MKFLIKDLARIYFCTGARNHDLLKFFDDSKLVFDIDERMASFKALGFSKYSSFPVAICTTSGTAVSECLSALLEAQYSGVPLVLITGDRPKKQHRTGAPQTVDHEALTRAVRGSFVEVTLEEFGELELGYPTYPLHINVLVDDTKEHELKIRHHEGLQDFPELLAKLKRPLFLFSHEKSSMREMIKKFSELKLPFYAEAMSRGRDLSKVKTEKQLVRLFKEGAFDGVIRIGHTPLSKVWRLLETKPLPVISFDERGLSGLSYGEVFKLSSGELVNEESFWKALEQLEPFTCEDNGNEQLAALQQKYPQAEISLFSKLQEKLPEGVVVYLGNSLIIRHFELTQNKCFKILGNRGVNGIDGQLASAIGIAEASGEVTYCILGDITTIYDLSSLGKMPQNLKLIIINNQGGRIFDGLKLDKRIVLEHEQSFADIAQAFHLTYSQDLKDFGQVQLLELRPTQKESEAFLKEWLD